MGEPLANMLKEALGSISNIKERKEGKERKRKKGRKGKQETPFFWYVCLSLGSIFLTETRHWGEDGTDQSTKDVNEDFIPDRKMYLG